VPELLRKAKGNRRGPPEWDEHDYDVKWDGWSVDRIYRRSGADHDAQPWFWPILVIAPGVTTTGLAATLDDAKAAFAQSWSRWLALAAGSE
jgi:hypothetical protein